MFKKNVRPVAQDKQVCEFLSGNIYDLWFTKFHEHSGHPPHFLSVPIMQFIFRSGILGSIFTTMLPPATPIIICDCVDYAPFRTSAIFTSPVRTTFTIHLLHLHVTMRYMFGKNLPWHHHTILDLGTFYRGNPHINKILQFLRIKGKSLYHLHNILITGFVGVPHIAMTLGNGAPTVDFPNFTRPRIKRNSVARIT